MTYEKPEIRDFGDIAKYTYQQGDDEIFCGGSPYVCTDVDF